MPACSTRTRATSLSLSATLIVLASALLLPGCATLQHENTAPYITGTLRARDDSIATVMFKTHVLYPARDVLTFDWLVRLLGDDHAWNAETDLDAGTSFCTPYPPGGPTPDAAAIGPCTLPPQPPFTILKPKTKGTTAGFLGADATGRRFLFKLDNPKHPELGTSSAIIGSRTMAALGYRVPEIYLVSIEGTGDPRFDGHRATAAAFLDNVRGNYRFDWFRYRREARALRMACAWLNDTDRGSQNTLVVEDAGRALYYQIDFNSCLGSWQGRPKKTWRGHRHAGDVGWILLRGLSFGLLHPEPNPTQPVFSPAVGRYDADYSPLAWRPQTPNTAFDHMTDADLRWIAARIRHLDRPHIEAIVAAAKLTNPADATYLVETLMARRAAILSLAEPSPETGTQH